MGYTAELYLVYTSILVKRAAAAVLAILVPRATTGKKLTDRLLPKLSLTTVYGIRSTTIVDSGVITSYFPVATYPVPCKIAELTYHTTTVAGAAGACYSTNR